MQLSAVGELGLWAPARLMGKNHAAIGGRHSRRQGESDRSENLRRYLMQQSAAAHRSVVWRWCG